MFFDLLRFRLDDLIRRVLLAGQHVILVLQAHVLRVHDARRTRPQCNGIADVAFERKVETRAFSNDALHRDLFAQIIDDLLVRDIEASGKTLIEIVKEKYNYRADRIQKAVDQMKE